MATTTAPVLDAATARRKKLRVWLVLASISVGWKVLVFTLGAALPRWLLDDGIAALPAHEREYGAEARRMAMGMWNGPIERHGVVRMVKVLSVDTLPHPTLATAAPTGAAATARCDGARLAARVRAYTYFAIPYSEVRTVCDTGEVEYRVFRRKAQASQ